MTHREQQLLSFIESYQRENAGVSPSFDEMSAALGLSSKSGAHRLLAGLQQKGRIRRMAFLAREIHVIPQAHDLSRVPDADILREYHARFAFRHSVASAAVEV